MVLLDVVETSTVGVEKNRVVESILVLEAVTKFVLKIIVERLEKV